MQNKIVELIGRGLLAYIFIMAGASKIGSAAATAGYMESVGVPGILVWPTIALELLGGIMILVGFHTRLAALALGAFSIIAAALFHNDFSNQMEGIMFSKNLAIAGGFFILAYNGAGPISVDARQGRA